MALENIIYLTDAEYTTLKTTGSVTIDGITYVPGPEIEFKKKAPEATKLYKHVISWDANDSSTHDLGIFKICVIDENSAAYTAATFHSRYKEMGFLGMQVNDGPPGMIAMICPTMDQGGGAIEMWGPVFKYGEDTNNLYAYFTFSSDAVIEL